MKPKVQYHHDKSHKRTVAVVAPSREDLLTAIKYKMIGLDPILIFNLGIAKMHPKETHYIKYVGRETALWNMNSVEGQLTYFWSHITNPDEIHFQVQVGKDAYLFKLTAGKNYSHLYMVL